MNVFKHKSALGLSAFGILLTVVGAVIFRDYGYRFVRKSTPSHVMFVSSTGYEFSDVGVNIKCTLMADEGNATTLFVMFDRPGSSTRPSQLLVSVDVNLNNSVPSKNGIWIDNLEQPLKPGLNVFYFSPTACGRVQVNPAEARQITNVDLWTQTDATSLAATLSQRLTPQQHPTSGH